MYEVGRGAAQPAVVAVLAALVAYVVVPAELAVQALVVLEQQVLFRKVAVHIEAWCRLGWAAGDIVGRRVVVVARPCMLG